MGDSPDDSTVYSPSQADTKPFFPDWDIEKLAHYRVVKQLGKGGMGVVLQAEDEQLRRLVALKVMRRDYASNSEAKSRFLREARAAAAIKHDNIVTIYQVGEDQGIPFLAMEFLKGISLDDWLRPDRRATVPETLAIGKQVIRGLLAAHEVGLIHRDIKPANLWLEDPSKRVKVLDFGLARGAEGEFTELTQQGTMLGTPAYMAPEQMRGETVDHRCDLFSFGCVLYRMTTGRLPFQGNTIFAVMAAVMAEEPPPVTAINSAIPTRLSNLIGRLLSKDANNRPASTQGVLDELTAIEDEWKGRPVEPGPPVVEKPGVPWRRVAAIIGLVVATATTLIAVAFFFSHREEVKTADAAKVAVVDPKPPKTPETPPTKPVIAKPVDLSAMIDLGTARKVGNWNTKGASIVGHPEDETKPFSLLLPWVPPDSYRLSFHVGRRGRTEGGSLGVALATGGTHFEVRIDEAANRSFYSGVTMIDNHRLAEREISHSKMHLQLNKPVQIICTVTPDEVKVTIDGSLIVQEKGNVRSMKRPGPPRPPLSLMGSGPSSFSFTDIVLEPLGEDRGHALK